ncbi:MAG: amino acid adenylation domain-containing protein, partial [Anaerolineales bacterium]|nr:amino acid adenylation domain-containing protein [Anaerolineales bacterium]
RSNGLTAPNGPSQQAVIRQAMRSAGVSAKEIGYIEAHGTGTPLGDPIEVQSYRAVLDGETDKNQKILLGSVKTNVGHLESAAGVAGVIKVLLALQHGEIPPHLHIKQINPYISFDGSPLEVATKKQPWPQNAERKLAGVSSFGFGGTNAHIILEEAPQPVEVATPADSTAFRDTHLLTLSAKSGDSLTRLAEEYQTLLESTIDETLPGIAALSHSRRDHFPHRLAVWGRSTVEITAELDTFVQGKLGRNLINGLAQNQAAPQLAFLFTGQGSQYAGMGRELYENDPQFKRIIDQADAILKPILEKPLLAVLYPADEADNEWINQTAYAQPALFALEYALALTWIGWDVRPDYLIGHSLGEYVAACIAGAFNFEAGLKLVAERGRLMQSLPQDGSMAAVMASREQVLETIADFADVVSIAAENSPQGTVISGSTEAVEAIVAQLKEQGIKSKLLVVSHAFHSHLMEPILDTFEQTAAGIEFQPLQIPVVSNVNGEILPTGTVLDAAYWREHIRQGVRFAKGMQSLDAAGCTAYLEVGPKPTLVSLGRATLPTAEASWLVSLKPEQRNADTLLESVAALYVNGGAVDWQAFDQGIPRQHILLPTYPFDRQSYWIEGADANFHPVQGGVKPKLGERFGEELVFVSRVDSALPAASLVEMALAAPAAAGLNGEYQPESFSFGTPVQGKNLQVKTALTPLSLGDLYVEISSQTEEDSAWTLHLSGKLKNNAPANGTQNGYAQDAEIEAAIPETSLKAQLLALNAEERQPQTEAYLMAQAAQVLHLDAANLTSANTLIELGLDSLMAIELKMKVAQDLGVDIPIVDLLEGPSFGQLAAAVLPLLSQAKEPEGAVLAVASEELGEHPLSHGQQSMWFVHQLVTEEIAFNPAGAVRVTGDLNLPALQSSLNTLIQRHPALRTTFHSKDGQPVQFVRAEIDAPIYEEDASGWDKEYLNACLEHDAYLPFDLENGPLVRLKIYQRGPDEAVALLAIHHIISDFWSLTVLVNELLQLYEAEVYGKQPNLPILELKYSDYVHWEDIYLAGQDGESAKAYWLDELHGELPVLNLPTRGLGSNAPSFRGEKLHIDLGAALTRTLKQICKDSGATAYMALLAAFQVLLHRYTGQEDIITATPLAGRDRPGLEGLVGYFINPVGIRADFSGDPSFLDVLEQVRQKVLGALSHQNYPPDLIAKDLNVPRANRHQLFQSMFIMQQAQNEEIQGFNAFALGIEGAQIAVNGTHLHSIQLNTLPAQFDLTLMVTELAEDFIAQMHYRTDLFDPATIDKMLAHLKLVLEGIAANPARPVGELTLLSEDELHTLLVDWNQTQANYPREASLPELFSAQAKQSPDAVALEFDDQKLTYKQLDQRSNQLARYLTEIGVRPDELVGIYLERSLEMVVALLGVLKAGAAYVPLDPIYPPDRIALMLEDSQAAFVLTESTIQDTLPPGNAQVLALDTLTAEIDEQSKRVVKKQATADSIMYVIYTSGSTGKPKGVKIPHCTVVNFLYSMQAEPGLQTTDRLLAVTTLSFDIAVLELYLPLITGATVVIAPREIAADGAQLADLIATSEATFMQATPSTWKMLLAAGWEGNPTLKILCGGEALSLHLANSLLDKCASLWNIYGPTETTVWSTLCEVCPGDEKITIGRPIANTQTYILDANLQPVPVGVVGELYIAGDGVGDGYLDRPELTAERFLDNPFGDGKMYRTGDTVRYLPDGQIEYLGRNDNQVKIRGHRIEIGEIEEKLLTHPGIKEAVVVARPDHTGETYLAAYVIAADLGSPPSVEQIRNHLSQQLPAYMLPAITKHIDKLPLTPNGKVDRKALPSLDGERPVLQTEYIPPSNEQEQILADLCQEILGVERIGIQDNFFDLGGNSLMATRLIFQVREKFSVDLPLLRLFENPTIAGLSRAIDQARFTVESGGRLAGDTMTIEKMLAEATLDE